MTLNQTTTDQIARYIENNPVEIYFDYRDELSSEQVTKLLNGQYDDVVEDISEYNHNFNYDELVGDDYWEELRKDLDLTEEQLEEFKDSNEMFWPALNFDVQQLIRNTSAYIGARYVNPSSEDFDVYFNDLAYGGPITYQSIRSFCQLFCVNPKKMAAEAKKRGMATKGRFYDVEYRDGPAVDIKEFFDNLITLYDGQIMFAFGDLDNVVNILKDNPKSVRICKGTNVVIYNYWNGAGIAEVTLTRDLKIPRQQLQFENDEENLYGVQKCYGFTKGFWDEGALGL